MTSNRVDCRVDHRKTQLAAIAGRRQPKCRAGMILIAGCGEQHQCHGGSCWKWVRNTVILPDFVRTQPNSVILLKSTVNVTFVQLTYLQKNFPFVIMPHKLVESTWRESTQIWIGRRRMSTTAPLCHKTNLTWGNFHFFFYKRNNDGLKTYPTGEKPNFYMWHFAKGICRGRGYIGDN